MRTDSYYNNISFLLDRYVPSFIKDEYPLFYNFLEVFYEWCEQNDKFVPWNILKNIQNWNDVDTTIDEFVEYFKNEYINLPIDENWELYIKHHKDIYSTKGSTKSLKFFIKLLTGLDTDIMYPNRYLMKSSDGVWRSYTIIFCEKDININYEDYVSTQILGGISNATGNVEKIEIYDNYIKVFLSSVKGTFTQEPIFFNNGVQFQSNIINTISSLNVVNGGNNYSIDDEVVITNYNNIKAKISSIKSGSLDKIELIYGGVGYQIGDILEFECDSTEEFSALPYAEVAEVVKPKYNFTYDIELNVLHPGRNYSVDDVLNYKDIQIKVTGVDSNGAIETFDVLTPIAFTQIDSDSVLMEGGSGTDCYMSIYSHQNELTNENEVGKITRVKILYNGYGLLKIPTLTNIITENGQGAQLKLFSDNAGAISKINITFPECNIQDTPIININTSTGRDVEITANISYQYQEIPYYYKDGSFLSDVFKLQDSYYWQEYSYVLNVAGSVLDKYKNIFKTILHPSGFIFFTNTILSNYIELKKYYVDSTLDVYEDLDVDIYINQYIELLHYYDRIRDESILNVIKNNVLDSIKTRQLDSFKRTGGGFIISNTLERDKVMFTINAIPEDATVIINDIETKSLLVENNSEITYKVEKEGYLQETGTIQTQNQDITLNIILKKIQYFASLIVVPDINNRMQISTNSLSNDWVINWGDGTIELIEKSSISNAYTHVYDTNKEYNIIIGEIE